VTTDAPGVPAPDFWRNSGFHLLERDTNGHLAVTDDFLRAYLTRPEVRPVEESCNAERALHAELMDQPRMAIPAERLAALADPDARDNYAVLFDFLGRLVRAGTVEACYASLFREDRVTVAPLFLDQMVHVVVRNILDGATDPMLVRAGETLFRPQTVTIHEGAILMADTETVEMYATTGGFGELGRLIVEGGAQLRRIDLDVLTDDNAALYWARDERHDTVLDVTFSRPGLDALCRVLERWVQHFLGAAVRIQPVQKIRDERWRWHVGLDAEASMLLDELYAGTEVAEERLEQILSLFRLEFERASDMRPDVAGMPVYLALAMTPAKTLRLKPQNLLINLPLAREV